MGCEVTVRLCSTYYITCVIWWYRAVRAWIIKYKLEITVTVASTNTTHGDMKICSYFILCKWNRYYSFFVRIKTVCVEGHCYLTQPNGWRPVHRARGANPLTYLWHVKFFLREADSKLSVKSFRRYSHKYELQLI